MLVSGAFRAGRLLRPPIISSFNFQKRTISRIAWRNSRLFKLLRESTASSQTPETQEIDPESKTFDELLTTATAASSVKLQPGSNGRGLFASHEISAAGKVILSVPVESCLTVDYNEGVNLPGGNWPRVQRGLAKDDALPWDIILSLALLDGLSGDGDSFWALYTNEILPPPEAMTLPVCLPLELLQELDHPAIIEAALAQKERLRTLFPGLAIPACDGGPTFFEWAFACVRSRAFRLGQEDIFAFVPFLDCANHAMEPNANFELSPDRRRVNLVSLKSIAEGEEVTISYTGEKGYANQRFMAQYGYVPSMGNPFDRIEFKILKSAREQNSNSVPLLSLDYFQAAIGDDEAMVQVFSGRDTYTYAALKSFPLAALESDAAPIEEQLELARTLLNEVQQEKGSWKTAAKDDAVSLVKLLEAEKEDSTAVDPREIAVVRYRLQRKRMIEAAESLLTAFLHR